MFGFNHSDNAEIKDVLREIADRLQSIETILKNDSYSHLFKSMTITAPAVTSPKAPEKKRGRPRKKMPDIASSKPSEKE